MALTSKKKKKNFIKIRFFVAFLDELFSFFFFCNQIIIFAISKEAVSVER